MTKNSSGTPTDILQAKLTLETAQIPWRELQRFFAAGKAVAVDKALDLTEVAAAFAEDDAAKIKRWMQALQVQPVPDTRAQQWFETDIVVWAVVVAPWVLVQEER